MLKPFEKNTGMPLFLKASQYIHLYICKLKFLASEYLVAFSVLISNEFEIGVLMPYSLEITQNNEKSFFDMWLRFLLHTFII
jgi:hypothetical protein